MLCLEEYEALQASTNESMVIQYLTPHLQKLVIKAGEGLGKSLRLVNSENHPWVETIGDPKKPDMFIAHPAVYKLVKTSADEKCDGAKFLFGIPGSFDLRDMMEVPIIEAKRLIGPEDFQAFGEGIDYVSCLCAFDEESDVPLDKQRILSTKCILIASNGFWLVNFESTIPIHCLHGTWTDAGSAQAIVDFIQYKRPEIERLWESALENLMTKFEVHLIEPDYHGEMSSFLGMGADGRVFRVLDSKDNEYAMKCAASLDGISKLREEWLVHEKFGERLSNCKCAAKLHKWHFNDEKKFAGLLFTPVGKPLQQKKYAIQSAVEGLKLLCSAGIQHNDARLPNVIWANHQAVWVDFRRSFGIDSKLQGGKSFVQSLKVFVESCNAGIKTNGAEFDMAASNYYLNDDFDAISFYLRPVWAWR